MLNYLSFFFRNVRFSIAVVAFLIYLIIINRASYLSIFVECILIVVFWIIYKPLSSSKYNGRLTIFIPVSFLLLIVGLLNGNKFDYILTDFIHLTPITSLILSSQLFRKDFVDDQLSGYKRIMPILILLYLGIFTYMGYSWVGSVDARFSYNQDTKLSLFAPLGPLAFFVFVFAYNKIKANTITWITIFIGVFAYLHMGFTTQTKTIFLVPIIIFGLKLVINDKLSITLKLLFFAILLYYTIIFVVSTYFPELVYLTEFFNDKFNSVDDSNTSRVDETFEYLSKCNFFQILFGKGFGGEKIFNGENYIGGVNMLHMGWGFLMMKGGILLLLIIYYPLFWIIINDIKYKHYCFAILAIYILLKDQMHTTLLGFNGAFVYWALVYTRYYYRNYFILAKSYEVK